MAEKKPVAELDPQFGGDDTPASVNNERDSRSWSAGSTQFALPERASRYAPRYASVAPQDYRETV